MSERGIYLRIPREPRHMAHQGTLLLILATLCLPAAQSCNKQAEQAAASGASAAKGPPPVNVMTASVQELSYAPAVELTGEMRSRQRVVLAAELSGRISMIKARVGDPVSAGSEFIRIDADKYTAQLAVAESQLEQAKLALREAQSGPRPEEIAEQRAIVAQANARLADASDLLQRLDLLQGQDVVSESELASARNAHDEARSSLDEEQRVLDRLLAGTRQEQLDSAVAAQEEARHRRELAALDLQHCSIMADFNASVTSLLVEVGQYVNAGTPLAELVSSEPAEAWFSLPENQRDQIGNGTAVELRCAALPGESFTGHVAGISKAADPATRQFPLRVSVAEARLLPGMSVQGRLLLSEPGPRLLFSQDAAYESRLGLVVYKVVDNTSGEAEGLPGFATVQVQLGERIDGLVLLESGELKAGDRLVTRGKESLFEGAKLRIQSTGANVPGEAPRQ